MFRVSKIVKFFLYYMILLLFVFITIRCNKDPVGFSEPTFIYNSYPLNPTIEKVDLYFSTVPYKNFLEIAYDFNPLLKYLNQKLNIKIQFVPVDQYYKLYELLQNGKIHLAFIDPYYINKNKNVFEIEFLVKPVYKEIKKNQTLLVTRNDQPLKSIKDIKSKSNLLTISFDNPYSFFGYHKPLKILNKEELNIRAFKNIDYTNNMENTVQGILSGNYDIGFIDSITYNKYKSIAIGIKSLYESEEFEHYPLVIVKSISPKIKSNVINALIGLNINNEEHKKILESINPFLTGFQFTSEKEYQNYNP